MIAQGTPQWFAARLGRVTASRVADVVGRTRAGWGAARAGYMSQLLAERLTGSTGDGWVSPAMQWGIDREPDARLAYQFRHDTDVADAGFVPHPRVPMSGASPDGFVGDDGLVEFKCPTTATHLNTLLVQEVPDRHQLQILWQLACTGRDWCDYVSYDPRLPEGASLFVARVTRDDDRIADLEEQVAAFLDELDQLVDLLDRQYGLRSMGIDRWKQLGPPDFAARGAAP